MGDGSTFVPDILENIVNVRQGRILHYSSKKNGTSNKNLLSINDKLIVNLG